jgi:hypothetical protein
MATKATNPDGRGANNAWTILVYRVPPQPTRLRLSIWRKLNAMGVLYIQDGVCLLPNRPDLTENLLYVAQAVEQMEGTCHVFSASALLPDGAETLVTGFRALADQRLAEIGERLNSATEELNNATEKAGLSPAALIRAEAELKRERVAYLRTRRLSHCGIPPETESAMDAKLDAFRKRLDGLGRETETTDRARGGE